ncbi:MAG: peptidase M61 [Bacteroidia bacterium]
MKRSSILFLILFSSVLLFSQSECKFSVDLTKCRNDKLFIELITPRISTENALYRLPKIVPGTYEIYDFGRFVSSFYATDSLGNELEVNRIDKNSWSITQAKKLYKIAYYINDTWDDANKDSAVFEPAGSNFEAGKNFMLNTHCLFGFFEGMTHLPYRVSITHPANFYGTCSLTNVVYKDNTDVYYTSNYMQLQDAPMMYNVPDTTTLMIGETEILVSLYSINKITNSKFIAENIKEILTAQKEYLGGSFPIKKYAYIIYLTPEKSLSGSNGALEHSYSSVYFLPEMEEEYLTQTIKDISAHEFFHIVTPLSIHAEQIGDFDYTNPQMSEHLWLYEGTTEYAAGLVQIKYGNMSISDYLKLINKKIEYSTSYIDSIAFTNISKGCLDKYKDQFGNVYQKGALIALCLDIRLLSLSNGKYGLQSLIKDLSKTYGKEKSFKDDELIDQIVKLTFPEVADFFKKYVAGSQPLPIKEMLSLVGVEPTINLKREITFGGVAIAINPLNNRIMIVDTSKIDSFGKSLGYKKGDEFLKFNGQKISPKNVQNVIGNYFLLAKENDLLKITVLRKNHVTGKINKIKLKASIIAVTTPSKKQLVLTENPTSTQLKLRNAWINK